MMGKSKMRRGGEWKDCYYTGGQYFAPKTGTGAAIAVTIIGAIYWGTAAYMIWRMISRS